MDSAEMWITEALVGVGGTLVLDLLQRIQQRFLGVPVVNRAMVGRWIGHMPCGTFVQHAIGKAVPIAGARAISWTFHYLIGTGYPLTSPSPHLQKGCPDGPTKIPGKPLNLLNNPCSNQ